MVDGERGRREGNYERGRTPGDWCTIGTQGERDETFIGSLKAGFVTERSELGSCRAFRVQYPVLKEVEALYSLLSWAKAGKDSKGRNKATLLHPAGPCAPQTRIRRYSTNSSTAERRASRKESGTLQAACAGGGCRGTGTMNTLVTRQAMQVPLLPALSVTPRPSATARHSAPPRVHAVLSKS